MSQSRDINRNRQMVEGCGVGTNITRALDLVEDRNASSMEQGQELLKKSVMGCNETETGYEWPK